MIRPLLLVAAILATPFLAMAEDPYDGQGQSLVPETAPPDFDGYVADGTQIGGSQFDAATGTWKLYTTDGRNAGTATYDPNGNGGRGDWQMTAPDGRSLGVFDPRP